ncbi:MAG: hypothetical protein KC729_12310 [Candidatus Eisenbacteria bacterium]|uniref:Amino acid transporter n=1 Tax=Eiseniibacteriota bacterium TaxID=2212470 RepID=A0A956M0S6_UNCEI|nr:hypothetical protein [Candidatus Eisenbacteria bacterium]
MDGTTKESDEVKSWSESEERWVSILPQEANEWLRDVSAPWWISGGWAIDLFLGASTRPHGDLDVCVLRRDEPSIRAHFPAWEFASACRGRLDPLPQGTPCPPESHSIWGRAPSSESWMLELVLEEADGEEWVYRKDPRIRRPLSRIAFQTEDGLPIIAPEIQLLYKAGTMRAKDEQDLRKVLPHLDAERRAWLDRALRMVAPDHRWIEAIEAGRAR